MTTATPTSAPPRTVGGRVWRCYSTGVHKSEWRSHEGRCAVGSFASLSSYWAKVDGAIILSGGRPGRSKRFRSLRTAMEAAAKAAGA